MTHHDHPTGVTCLPAEGVWACSLRRASKAFEHGGYWLLAVLLCTSCSTGKKPDPDWNRLHLWHQVAAQPPTYVPKGYGADRPLTEHDGTWFTDSRDGKRLYVPKQGVPGWTPGVLAGEAKKVTGYDGKPRLTWGEKIWWGSIATLAGMGGSKLSPPD